MINRNCKLIHFKKNKIIIIIIIIIIMNFAEDMMETNIFSY